MQNELFSEGKLLNEDGTLSEVGWSRQPLLDSNLEDAKFYQLRMLQRFRIKRWDYYAIFTPRRFFSATIADLGYAGNIFVYTLDFETKVIHEEGLVIPLGAGVTLPRNNTAGNASFSNDKVSLHFIRQDAQRKISVSWPEFHEGRGIEAEITLDMPQSHESMNIVIPIGKQRFYYNHKINCLPAKGKLRYGEIEEELTPDSSVGSLDWGRGVWDYQSKWKWASASGFLADGGTIGLNLGYGFGDNSAATENALILNGAIHKLDQVGFDYDPANYMKPWNFRDNQGRLELTLTPFTERVAQTNLGIIFSEVHQMFGKYSGFVIDDAGNNVIIDSLIGFAEDHIARW
jgi:hypothetical protein